MPSHSSYITVKIVTPSRRSGAGPVEPPGRAVKAEPSGSPGGQALTGPGSTAPPWDEEPGSAWLLGSLVGPISGCETADSMAEVARKRPLTWAEVEFERRDSWGQPGSESCSRVGDCDCRSRAGPESVEEYAEVLDESRATAFRDQQAFRKAFPTEETPPAWCRPLACKIA